ncbi:hypothetical protein PR048_016752 [Dryococelus australis]|uniref:Uncharacterized protein n=1 Tax=Dryococelus australis TaxID=614101 RepID=A0ABQ9H7P1_9NEOP|nr:hypothetical protein PR048_016752 [Dryococelus australis]
MLTSDIKLLLCDAPVLSVLTTARKVQNACLRYCFKFKKRYHVTDALFTSKWLNMGKRCCAIQPLD